MKARPLYPLALVLATSAIAPGQDAQPRSLEEMHRLHQDAKSYIAMLEDPARDAYQKPHEVIAALDLKPGEVVADIGSGSGYFTLRLAAHVGEGGRVYGVDIDPELVRHLNRRIRDAGLRNVHAILADADDPLLPEPVDRFVIVDTWHHISDQARYLGLLHRLLKPGGQVVMIDFQKRELPLGPPLAMKIAREDLIRQMEANGFRLAQEHAFLPYQYFLVFEAKPADPAPAEPVARLGDAWAAVRFMVGEWQGEAEGQPGKGSVARSYGYVLGERFLYERNVSTYAPQPKNEKGERHEHWSFFGLDRARRTLVLRQFHQEGFVNQYLMLPVADGGDVVFETEALENVPPGWKARESYHVVSPDEFVETFELSQGGKPYEVYSRSRLRRVRGQTSRER